VYCDLMHFISVTVSFLSTVNEKVKLAEVHINILALPRERNVFSPGKTSTGWNQVSACALRDTTQYGLRLCMSPLTP
jgi:hypothetical protein